MKKAILLKVGVDGEHELSQVNFGTEHTLEDYYRFTDCSTIDVVSCYGISGINADMIVDDEGLLNGKPVETPDGVVEDGFTAEEIDMIMRGIISQLKGA